MVLLLSLVLLLLGIPHRYQLSLGGQHFSLHLTLFTLPSPSSILSCSCLQTLPITPSCSSSCPFFAGVLLLFIELPGHSFNYHQGVIHYSPDSLYSAIYMALTPSWSMQQDLTSGRLHMPRVHSLLFFSSSTCSSPS